MPEQPSQQPRLFRLMRQAGPEAYGTSHLADGVQWHDGTATVRWHVDHTSTGNWDSIDDAIATAVAIHGGIRLQWEEDYGPQMRLRTIASAHAKKVLPGGMTSGDCAECGHSWPCPTHTWATKDHAPCAAWDPDNDREDAAP